MGPGDFHTGFCRIKSLLFLILLHSPLGDIAESLQLCNNLRNKAFAAVTLLCQLAGQNTGFFGNGRQHMYFVHRKILISAIVPYRNWRTDPQTGTANPHFPAEGAGSNPIHPYSFPPVAIPLDKIRMKFLIHTRFVLLSTLKSYQ